MLLSFHWSQARSPWEGLKARLLLLHMPNGRWSFLLIANQFRGQMDFEQGQASGSPHLKDELAAEVPRLAQSMGLDGLR